MLGVAVFFLASAPASGPSGFRLCRYPASVVGMKLQAAEALLKQNGCDAAVVTACATPARSNGTVLRAVWDATQRNRIVLYTGSTSSRYCNEAGTVTTAGTTPAGPSAAATPADKAVAQLCAIFEPLGVGSAPVVSFALTSNGCVYVILPGPSSQGVAGARFRVFAQDGNVCRSVSNLPAGYAGIFQPGTACSPP